MDKSIINEVLPNALKPKPGKSNTKNELSFVLFPPKRLDKPSTKYELSLVLFKPKRLDKSSTKYEPPSVLLPKVFKSKDKNELPVLFLPMKLDKSKVTNL